MIKKYLHLVLAGTLYATPATHISAREYKIDNITDNEVAIQLILDESEMTKSDQKVIAPQSTVNFNLTGRLGGFCVLKIRYIVNPSSFQKGQGKMPAKKENSTRTEKLPSSICKDAQIIITPGRMADLLEFTVK